MQFLKNKLIVWLLFLTTAVIYLSFPTKNYYWDGVEFAAQIESAPALSPSLLHPNHLVYNILGSLVFALVNSARIEIRSLQVLQIINSICAAGCVLILFLILKKSFRSIYLSAVLSFLFAFSATWWKFATDANAYIPSILFLLAAFYFLLPSAKPKFWLIAVLHCIAMLFHQLAIFFYPVAVLGIYIQSEPSERLKNTIKYSSAAGLLTLSAFVTGFVLQSTDLSLSAFARWITNYSPEVGFTFNFWSNLGYTLRGHARLFFDGRFNFFKFNSNPLTTILFFALASLLIIFGVQAIRYASGFGKLAAVLRENYKPFRSLALLILTWIISYFIFLFFFIPQNTFYRLFYLPALIIGIGIVWAIINVQEIYQRTWRAALFVAVVAIANFLFFIEPYSRVRDETPLLMALQLRQIWSPQTIVYFARANTDNQLVKYFNPNTTWKKLETINLNDLKEEIAKTTASADKNVWLETSAIQTIKNTAGGELWLAQYSSREQSIYTLHDPAYNLSFMRIFP